MKHGSLFSGGGGFDLAAERVGWQNVFHCEKDTFCRKILKHYWPEAETIEDIKEFDGTRFAGTIDIISGGFPCQPFSIAGKRRGTEDDRYLWPEMLRIIRQVKPRWVVGENVLGLVNWNDGLVLEQVQLDLEGAGYEVSTFVLPAAGVNAPHQRYRVWIVAYNAEYDSKRKEKDHSDTCSAGWAKSKSCRKIAQRRERRKCKQFISLCEAQLEKVNSNPNLFRCKWRQCRNGEFTGKGRKYAQRHFVQVDKDAANTCCKRSKPKKQIRTLAGQRPRFKSSGANWRDWPTQSPLCGRDDGLPDRLDGITFPEWRRKSIKMYGNAIVPQVAVQLFSAIQSYEANSR